MPGIFHVVTGCGCIATLALAAPGVAQTSLTIGNVPAYPGTTVAVPVGLRQAPGTAVAMQFDVAFNASKVSMEDAVRGERLTNHVVRTRRLADGTERVLIYSLDSTAIPGTNSVVASIPFNVAAAEHVSSGPLVPNHLIIAGAGATRVLPVSANAGVIFVREVNFLPDGQAQFFLPSRPDETYVIQATTDFVSWMDILTNTASGTFMDLLDVDAATYPHRFYRSLSQESAAPARP